MSAPVTSLWNTYHYGPECQSLAAAIHSIFTSKSQTWFFASYRQLTHQLSF